jgi:hypothetical protein
VPAGPNRTRPLGVVGTNGANGVNGSANGVNGTPPNGFNGRPGQGFREPPYAAQPQARAQAQEQPQSAAQPEASAPAAEPPAPAGELDSETYPVASLNLPDGVSAEEAYFAAYRQYVRERGDFPGVRQLARTLQDSYGGTAPEERQLITAVRELRYRFNSESDTAYIP